MLVDRGDNVELITSDFSHGVKKPYKEIPSDYPYKITMLHEPRYNNNVSVKRFLSHFMWGRNVKKYLKNRRQPDVVYSAVPPLYAATASGRYCNRNNIKYIIDIQDLWPEGFKMVFNIPIIKDVLFLPFSIMAKEVYRRADLIFSVSQTYADIAIQNNKKVQEAHAIFLGTDLSRFDDNKNSIAIDKPQNEIWLGYCGTLGVSYDLMCVFDALRILDDKSIRFIIMGNGPMKKEFEDRVNELGIKATFTGMLPYEKMCSLLSKCDIVINPIAHGAAGSIINKHADYAAVGLPVINTQESLEYRKMVDEYQMGFNCRNNDPLDLANKISILINDRALRISMGENARKCAEDKFNRKNTYATIINQINK